MKVFKFGGTSLGDPERMRQVGTLVSGGEPVLVVLSAVSGTTDKLEAIARLLYGNEKDRAREAIEGLRKEYEGFVADLFSGSETHRDQAMELIHSHFDHMLEFTEDMFTVFEEKAVMAQGELLSTSLFHLHLKDRGVETALLPALEFVRLDDRNEPDLPFIGEHLKSQLEKAGDRQVYITQGYICRNAFGEIDNLKRGGSDYTASLIGTAMGSEEIQIWTDVSGMHNNDPRVVDETHPIRELSFNEAAELAYFGAKILHPSSVRPAKEANIPVRLKNTMDPEAPGTLISGEKRPDRIKAIAAKDDIIAIRIQSGRMLMAHGFIKKVFEVFDIYRTPIDMITTSEVAVSLTIDDDTYLNDIVKDLEGFGHVEVDRGQSIICVVGDMLAEKKGYAERIFSALRDVPVRMISYGGSDYNVSLLVDGQQKGKALQALNDGLFEKAEA